MNERPREQIHEQVIGILRRLLPGADTSALPRGASLRRALAADSMDILNFVTALHDELGVDVPERDYPLLDTLQGCVDYIAAATAAPGKN
ncbi:MAG TPA: acyl carrier protein [Burkholderiales bacterium]|jgi:acyl carrier protein